MRPCELTAPRFPQTGYSRSYLRWSRRAAASSILTCFFVSFPSAPQPRRGEALICISVWGKQIGPLWVLALSGTGLTLDMYGTDALNPGRCARLRAEEGNHDTRNFLATSDSRPSPKSATAMRASHVPTALTRMRISARQETAFQATSAYPMCAQSEGPTPSRQTKWPTLRPRLPRKGSYILCDKRSSR